MLVGDAEKAEKLAEQLFGKKLPSCALSKNLIIELLETEEGVLVTSMCFPVVPQGKLH